jgi:Tol biopolymer transport system component
VPKRHLSLLPLLLVPLFAVMASQPSSATSPGTTRVNVASDGTESNGWSHFPAMSSDGRFVAFYSEATDLVIGDNALCDMNFDGIRNENCNDVFVHDLDTGATELVSLNSDEVQADDGSARPSISADGRFVTFLSIASNLVSGDTNNETDIFIRDRVLGVTERVSVDSNEAQGARHGEAASLLSSLVA